MERAPSRHVELYAAIFRRGFRFRERELSEPAFLFPGPFRLAIDRASPYIPGMSRVASKSRPLPRWPIIRLKASPAAARQARTRPVSRPSAPAADRPRTFEE